VSVPVLWFRIRIRTGSGFNGVPGSGPDRSQDPDPGAKITHKQDRKFFYKFHFLKCWMFSIDGEGFSYSLDIGKLQFLIKKKIIFSCNLQILVIETLDPDSLKMLDPDP
jgi:hypothetical protein